VVAALEQAGGRVRAAAQLLGVSRRHAYNCLEVLGLWGELERVRQAAAAQQEAQRGRAAATLQQIVPEGEEVPAVLSEQVTRRPRPCWWRRRRTA
jgi:hypothetical protein